MAIYYPGNILSTTERTTSSSSASGMWSMPAHVQKTKSGSWPSITPPAAAADTYFKYTTLLLHGDGTNGANNTVVVDSSINALTVTNTGKPYQGTFSPFSQTGWSNYFNGSGDYLSYAGTTVGTNVYTFECWFYINATQTHCLLGTGNIGGLNIRVNNTLTSIAVDSYNTSAQNFTVPTISLNTWYHLAVTRNASNGTDVWLNGVKSSSGTITLSTNYSTASNFFGRTESIYMAGYVSNARLVIGTALYTANFTPSTTPLTAVSNTVLLICQDNRFKDNSTNAYAITPNGSPQVLPFSPFAPTIPHSNTTVGGSINLSGSSNYVTVPNATVVNSIGSGPFTIEGWFYPLSLPGTTNFWGINNGSGSTAKVVNYFTSGTLYLDVGNMGATQFPLNVSASLIVNNAWNHIAYVRSGTGTNQSYVFVNGALANTGTISSAVNFTNITQPFNIGYVGENYGTTFNGYVSNFRISNTALYTAAITLPTAPFTVTSNTILQIGGTNAGIADSTARNVISTSAGASVSTTQSKFGGSSISFNGTDGYLQLLNTRFNNIPASTDFTLECWVYTTVSNRAPNVWHNVSSQKIIAFYLSSADFNNISTIMGPFSYPVSNASVVRGTTNIVANTWTHIAFVRSGSTITVYVDGTACGTGTSSYASLPLQLVGAISTGTTTPDFYFFPGYIDDLRLTIGVARYTGNFTPSTTAFENQ